jgi:hypothetical protein
MSRTRQPFDFAEFAHRIYLERPNEANQPFLLPALYGGESRGRYEAMFVLEAPSASFTRARWEPCSTPQEAIAIHRRIFLDWAHRELLPTLLRH